MHEHDELLQHAWYTMNVRTHMIHDEWYMMHDTTPMIHDAWYMMNCYSTHTWYMMNCTWWMLQYTRWIMLNATTATSTITTASLRTITLCFGCSRHWHTQPHRSSPNNVAVPVSVVWCLLIWSGRRPWRYGRKRWQENEALVGYARMHVDVCSMVINAALPGNAYWLVNTVHTGSNHTDTTRVVTTIQWSVLDTSNNHTVKRTGH